MSVPPLGTILRRTVPPVPLHVLSRAPQDSHDVEDPEQASYDQVLPRLVGVRRGESVAIGVGSRGITSIGRVVSGVVRAVLDQGGRPFIVPAMGSHGGGSAPGQRETLAGLGITEEHVGAPVRTTMDTLPVGEHAGVVVAVDAYAGRADHLLVVNRLKSHTSFSGEIESGLAKMLAIGLGKQHGAEELHRLGPTHLEARIRSTARYLTGQLPVLGGLALIEGVDKRLIHVAFVAASGIGGDEEAALLTRAKRHEARLPFDEIDVLLVDTIGKEFSGTGMDTNVIGRRMVRSMPELEVPRISTIVCLRISPGSHGNAVGIGLADFVPVAALEGFDPVATYTNTLTAGSQALQRAQIPIVMNDDADAVRAAILTSDVSDVDDLRLARIRNTLHLDEMLVSRRLAEQAPLGYTSVLGSHLFDSDGALAAW